MYTYSMYARGQGGHTLDKYTPGLSGIDPLSIGAGIVSGLFGGKSDPNQDAEYTYFHNASHGDTRKDWVGLMRLKASVPSSAQELAMHHLQALASGHGVYNKKAVVPPASVQAQAAAVLAGILANSPGSSGSLPVPPSSNYAQTLIPTGGSGSNMTLLAIALAGGLAYMTFAGGRGGGRSRRRR